MKIHTEYNTNYFWRIIFTAMVVWIHSNWAAGPNSGWYIAVEYFFIVSGYLLMESFEKHELSVYNYIKNRIVRLYPHQLLAFLVLFFWSYRGMIRNSEWKNLAGHFVLHLGEALPFTYFFSDYQTTGVYFLNFSVWYISVLLLVSLIYYYLLKYHAPFFRNLVIPLIIVLGYGYIYRYCISLNQAEFNYLFLNGFYLRGFCAMACGCGIYCLIKRLKGKMFSKLFYAGARTAEFVCIPAVIFLSYRNGNSKNDVWLVLLLCAGVFCSFLYSEETVFCCDFMKKASGLMYPVYLNHIFVFRFLDGFEWFPDVLWKKLLIFAVCIILYSVFTDSLIKWLTERLWTVKKRILTVH